MNRILLKDVLMFGNRRTNLAQKNTCITQGIRFCCEKVICHECVLRQILMRRARRVVRHFFCILGPYRCFFGGHWTEDNTYHSLSQALRGKTGMRTGPPSVGSVRPTSSRGRGERDRRQLHLDSWKNNCRQNVNSLSWAVSPENDSYPHDTQMRDRFGRAAGAAAT